MQLFFESKERQDRLKIILDSWLGTPWRHHTGVKGRGTDCIFFTARVYQEMGIISEFEVMDYAPDWHLHRSNEYLYEGIINQSPCVEIENARKDNLPNDLMNGDLVLYKYGRASAHSGIYFDGYIYEATRFSGGVVKTHWKIEKDRLTHVFRPLEV